MKSASRRARRRLPATNALNLQPRGTRLARNCGQLITLEPGTSFSPAANSPVQRLPGRRNHDFDGGRADWRADRRGRLDRPRGRRRRDRQLRFAPAFSRAVCLVGGQAYRIPMAALENAKSHSDFSAICLPLLGLSSGASHAVVACHAFHSIRSAPRVGCCTRRIARVTASSYPGGVRGVARSPANHGQRGDQGAWTGRTGGDRPRHHPGGRSRRVKAAQLRMLRPAWRAFRSGDRTQGRGLARLIRDRPANRLAGEERDNWIASR